MRPSPDPSYARIWRPAHACRSPMALSSSSRVRSIPCIASLTGGNHDASQRMKGVCLDSSSRSCSSATRSVSMRRRAVGSAPRNSMRSARARIRDASRCHHSAAALPLAAACDPGSSITAADMLSVASPQIRSIRSAICLATSGSKRLNTSRSVWGSAGRWKRYG